MTQASRGTGSGDEHHPAGRVRSLVWRDGALHLIDQRHLPLAFETVVCRTAHEVAEAIRTMVVRGAPAIGASAAYGMVLGARELLERGSGVRAGLLEVADLLKAARPTAVNLFWAVDRMLGVLEHWPQLSDAELVDQLEAEAGAIAEEDARTCRAIGGHGAELLEPGGVLTHCNTGALATVDYGTALGVIRAAHSAGKQVQVYACETRPFLQGARLTTWELLQEGIPVTLITDNMAAYVMARGLVKSVIVGADRITANGDVVNKIGTYGLAVLAKEHGIPFYVAAPVSTLDGSLRHGWQVPIEERNPQEVTHVLGQRIAPEGVSVINPAFDVTPNRYVTAIITEYGVVRPPFEEGLARLLQPEKRGATSA
ncbi:MAG: S-methyl-5-thioribose-1-phosphate isomerase [Firmicutes bacterium ZCTH02-B6]|nr:MAG: S-methyl-5-thioribose-1-phosphate isomerase [Firmicutes bacterium ZCTH02-B6]